MKIYLIGSLRNPVIPEIGNKLRALGIDVFDDWFAGGKRADDSWKDYEQRTGHTYSEALRGRMARHIFEFDKHHLDDSDAAILVAPAGRSGHLELGYMVGQGKCTVIYFPDGEPKLERWEVMTQFADYVVFDEASLLDIFEDHRGR